MDVTCSKQALYTPMTKSEEGLTSCSLLTFKPHSDRAVIISGIGIFGNQYCPDMIVFVVVVVDERDSNMHVAVTCD
jgi:hypothetical protein